MEALVGRTVVYLRAGMENATSPVFPMLTAGKEYTIQSVRKIGGAQWIGIIGDDGRGWEFDYKVFTR